MSCRGGQARPGNRRLEDAVIDWINRAVSEPDVEALPDDEPRRPDGIRRVQIRHFLVSAMLDRRR